MPSGRYIHYRCAWHGTGAISRQGKVRISSMHKQVDYDRGAIIFRCVSTEFSISSLRQTPPQMRDFSQRHLLHATDRSSERLLLSYETTIDRLWGLSLVYIRFAVSLRLVAGVFSFMLLRLRQESLVRRALVISLAQTKISCRELSFCCPQKCN
jgi:hypothetical protein